MVPDSSNYPNFRFGYANGHKLHPISVAGNNNSHIVVEMRRNTQGNNGVKA